jgi:bacillithiol biosynthesis deacetylase BshB1
MPMNASSAGEVSPVDVLAIAAHRDDVEQTCGGTLLRMAVRGLRTAILDLTQGEAGTRGSAAERAAEAAEAARLLHVDWRQALDLPDGAVENTLENRLKMVRVLRQARPRVVILPYWQARHPDHAAVATLGYEACFLSGLAKIETGAPPHRPFKIVYASLYADVRPSFIVDITPFIEQRQAALMAYRSQYANQAAGGGLFVPEEEIRERIFAEARHYGLLAGVRYGEPFVQKEVGLVDDLTLLPVQSI